MDFARKQLEKYGWSDGKGLGKNENGIPQALKPKLKRSVAGIGHDAAADFTEHWWSALYDKAANNVQVEEKNGKTKNIKTKDPNEFEITNSTWRIKRKRKEEQTEEQYADYFVKKAVLCNGGSRTEKVVESDSDNETEKKDVLKMTDEELFAACGGRTAHKGARHGLKALGKLARIEQQEKELLNQARFEGYSHAKNKKKEKKTKIDEIVEDLNLNSDNDVFATKTKKVKKKKHIKNEIELIDTEINKNENSSHVHNEMAECIEPLPKNKKKRKKIENVASNIKEETEYNKSINEVVNNISNLNENSQESNSKKRKKNKVYISNKMKCDLNIDTEFCNTVLSDNITRKIKKKKTKNVI